MKTDSVRSFGIALTLLAGVLWGVSARAAISGINSSATSYAQIQFLDTTSFDPSSNPGITSISPGVGPWNGATFALPFTTDPVTFDFAQGDITASFAGNNYSLALNNIVLNQAPLNTGFAHLIFQFSVEYQLDAAGLPLQTTLFPNFLVNGTVQSTAGSFAAVGGFIDYYGVNTAGTYGVLETVNYNALFTAPGSFSAVIPGIPVSGTTPLLVGNTTLTLAGTINFMVDPASINVQTVPEPGSGLLLGVAALSGLLWRRRVARAAAGSQGSNRVSVKTNFVRLLLVTLIVTGGLLPGDSARAAISGINTPGTSSALITFNDLNSFDPLLTPGVTIGGPAVSPWNGATVTLSPTTDPVTLDYAQGDIDASFIGNTYSLGVNNTTLTQAPLNTGYANLLYQFSVEYQLDAFGLPGQATLYPNFIVNGTVQPGGFAYVRGQIDYYNVNTLVETVGYSSIFNTPGSFAGIVAGMPVSSVTPAMAGNTTLTLTGFFEFVVDPASINVQSVLVPEPAGGLLLGVAGLSGILWRRRRA